MGDIHRPDRLPLRDRVPYLHIERGTLHAVEHALVLDQGSVRTTIPVASVAVLFLEPGVTVTHAAIALCAPHGTLLLWTGEAGVRLYGVGLPTPANGGRLLEQAALRLRPRSRIAVARRFYALMLGRPPPPANSIEKLLGIEGAFVRARYADLATSVSLPWQSRETAPPELRDALGYGSAALYGLCEAVILACGYSPAIGFIHSGDRRSLVFDLADTVKFQTVVPLAFNLWASGMLADPRSAMRRGARDLFRKERLIDTLFANLLGALNAP